MFIRRVIVLSAALFLSFTVFSICFDQSYSIETCVKNEKPINYMIYFSRSSEGNFNDANARLITKNASDDYSSITFKTNQYDIKSIRFDVGDTPGNVSIKYIKIKSGHTTIKTIEPKDLLGCAMNQIDSITVDNNFNLSSAQPDPYIIINNLILTKAHGVAYYYIMLILCFLFSLAFVLLIKKHMRNLIIKMLPYKKFFLCSIVALATKWYIQIIGINNHLFNGIFILLILYFTWKLYENNVILPKKYLHNAMFVLALFSSFVTYIGFVTESNDEVFAIFSTHSIIQIFVIVAGFGVVYYLFFINFADKVINCRSLEEQTSSDKFNFKRFFVTWAVIFVFWIPYFLGGYPGAIDFDTNYQLQQAVGIAPIFTGSPVAVTWLLGILYKIGHAIFRVDSGAIAFITISQMLMVSCVASYSIAFLRKIKTPKFLIYILIASLAILPVNGMNIVRIGKDTLFATAILLMVTSLADIIIYRNNRPKILPFILFVLGGVLTVQFRANGIYMVAPLAILTAIFLFSFIQKKKMFFIMSTCFAVIFVANFVLTSFFIEFYNIDTSPTSTKYTLPLMIPNQQVARVLSYNGNISEKERAFLDKNFMTKEAALQAYKSWISDSTGGASQLQANKQGEFIKVWLMILIKNPGICTDAYLHQTYGFYTPITTTRAPIEGFPQAENNPKFPAINSFINKIYMDSLKEPGISLTWGIGIAIMMLFAFAIISFYKRGPLSILIYAPIILLWATLLISTPLYYEMRYIYSLFLALPVLIGVAFTKEPNNRIAIKEG